MQAGLQALAPQHAPSAIEPVHAPDAGCGSRGHAPPPPRRTRRSSCGRRAALGDADLAPQLQVSLTGGEPAECVHSAVEEPLGEPAAGGAGLPARPHRQAPRPAGRAGQPRPAWRLSLATTSSAARSAVPWWNCRSGTGPEGRPGRVRRGGRSWDGRRRVMATRTPVIAATSTMYSHAARETMP